MADSSFPRRFFNCLCITAALCFVAIYQVHASPYNSVTVSSFTYSRTVLKPYEWRYLRVDLPSWFSSVSISLLSDADIDPQNIRKVSRNSMPMICAREGSPPLPDVYNTSLTGLVLDSISNGSFGATHGLTEQCYPMQKNISVILTNEQISPGIWYLGLFNGIGSTRTQGKMINRGPSYSFNGNISVEGCSTPMMWGKYCNQTVDQLSCVDSYNSTTNSDSNLTNQTSENVSNCKNDFEKSCSGYNETKLYSLDIVSVSEKIVITAANLTNQTGNFNSNGIILMCYARYGAMPLVNMNDYSGNINNASLVIQSPKVGRWYVIIQPLNLTNDTGEVQIRTVKFCYSLEWNVFQCPVDKAGFNCTGEKYALQTVLRKNPSGPFESYYLPVSNKVSAEAANFLLQPLLTNNTNGQNSTDALTYFLLEVPDGAAGANIHIRLTSDTKTDKEIYIRYGGFPSIDDYDYYYTNSTSSSSNNSMFFKLYDSSEKTVSFYILYAKGGRWGFGLRNLKSDDEAQKDQTSMSISLERCPRRCSSHGTCQSVLDTSGLTLYSYCSCDRNHGGFDCSVVIVSHKGHIWQSIALIASNAAAILPAYWALRNRAFSEWVLYTSSGISSGLYHACDVGTWCALSFHVLQFMDFWLSFMAVVSTFVYLAYIDEMSKRTIHTVVAILTALMAETGATRSSNIVLVISIGAIGLLIGWLMEFFSNYRSISFSTEYFRNMLNGWDAIREWIHNVIKTLLKRFRWGFVLAGFAALAMAAISWKLETSESYWIWHSMWHVSIYTSSFLFLCSKAKAVDTDDQRLPDANYALTRQDSIPRAQL